MDLWFAARHSSPEVPETPMTAHNQRHPPEVRCAHRSASLLQISTRDTPTNTQEFGTEDRISVPNPQVSARNRGYLTMAARPATHSPYSASYPSRRAMIWLR
jgi:hypothetical protein